MPTPTPEQGNIFVVSAASGTGKTTLLARLTQQHADIRTAVSHTTRSPREGEQHGKHYYFVSEEKFMQMVGNGEFLEHAQVFGNFYGTGMETVRRLQEQGVDVILEIDVQGAAQIRQVLPEAVGIFILPPDLATLEARLRNRQTDSNEVIARRLAEAEAEIAQAFAFDYVVINRDLIEAQAELFHIIRAQRARQKQRRASIEKVLQHQ